MRVLYLVHDLGDPAVARRAAMLRLGGAEVRLGGFRRGPAPAGAHGRTIELGPTRDARMLDRAARVALAAWRVGSSFRGVGRPDIVVARNLEMLALAIRLRARLGWNVPVVYECLDIHRLMLGRGAVGGALRSAERWALARAAALITSSPAFVREHFAAQGLESGLPNKLPVLLVENKPIEADAAPLPVPLPARVADRPARTGPIVIGWFGALRCARSLDLLDAFTRDAGGRFEAVLAGRPALAAVPDFHERVARAPYLRFHGAYAAGDLPALYGAVDLAWAIDFYEADGNSRWLLPNRLYEGSAHGAVPVALEGTETARTLRARGVGIVLAGGIGRDLAHGLGALDRAAIEVHRERLGCVDRSAWVAGRAECADLVARLAALGNARARGPGGMTALVSPTARERRPAPGAGEAPRAFVVVPCLDEEAHLEALLRALLDDTAFRGLPIVVADGGSTDASRKIVRRLGTETGRVHLLDNPAQLQGAGVNLAVERFGDGHDFLIRVDAHGAIEPGFSDALIEEADATGAASVTCAMRAVGAGPVQRAVAIAQNSALGNGGSAHRTGAGGRWVEHGHHALMRVDAFRAVGGYDPTFRTNEDAELDARLRGAGHRIWLTGRTGVVYYPRATFGSLFRQYRRYGEGRARTVLKHRERPRLRQLLPLGVVPAVLLLALAPWWPLALAPALAWAGACALFGLVLAWRVGALAAPVAAMVMHFAWGWGFLGEIARAATAGARS